MTRYSFITAWKLEAPLDKVWDVIYHSEKWSEWWDSVSDVIELKKGDESGLGSIKKYKWKTPLGYTLSFDVETTKVEPPTCLEGIAKGELNGIGKWHLSGNDIHTNVIYHWDVHTTKSWMNYLTPIARPIFRWNHDRVMDKGYSGLCRLLNYSSENNND